MSDYTKRLKAHPGVPSAVVSTVAGFALRGSVSLYHGLVGALVAGSITWPVVLWTARNQPLPEDSTDE